MGRRSPYPALLATALVAGCVGFAAWPPECADPMGEYAFEGGASLGELGLASGDGSSDGRQGTFRVTSERVEIHGSLGGDPVVTRVACGVFANGHVVTFVPDGWTPPEGRDMWPIDPLAVLIGGSAVVAAVALIAFRRRRATPP